MDAANARSFLSTKEVARRLDLTENRVRQLAAAGRFAGTVTTSLGRLFDPEQVERFIAERAARQSAGA